MFKQLSTKTLLLLLTMVVGVGNSWAADQVVYTLDGTKTGGTSDYTVASTITQNEMEWSVVGNTTTNPWRIGGKSLDGVDRDITGKTAFSKDITKITFNHAGTTSDKLIVNSVKLTVADDADFSSVIDEVTLTPTISKNTAGSFDFTPTSPLTEWATGSYYKFTINVSNSNNSNYAFCLSSVVFYTVSSKTATTTAIDSSGITNTDLFTGTSAGQLTATVSAGETTLTDAAITWTSSVPGVATVDEDGNVTLVATGTTTIKATYAGDDYYLGSEATYNMTVEYNDPNALNATFDFSANKYNWESTSNGNTYFDGSSYNATEGVITVGFSGKVRLWESSGSYTMRLYSDETYGRGKMTLTAADGYVITGVSISGSTLSFQNPSSGTINGGEWTGSAKVLTIEKGSSTSNFYKVEVSYTQDTGLHTPTVTIDATGITNTNAFVGTAAGSLAATVTYNDAAISGATVTWSGNNNEVATIDASTGAVTLVAAGSVTFTATFAGNEEYNEATATYQMTVTNSDPNGPGTVNNPYTVAQAYAAIDANEGITDVCVKGIVTRNTYFSSSNGTITYFISDDGTENNELEAYSGKGINGAKFTAQDDIQVGDVVVVRGNLTLYHNNNTNEDIYEFSSGNQLVSLDRKEVKYYLAGSWGENNYGWGEGMEQLTKSGSTYTISKDLANGTLFKIVKVDETVTPTTTTWYGGPADGDWYGVNSTLNKNLTLSDTGKNFKIEGDCDDNFTFTVNAENPDALTLTVTGWHEPVVKYYLAGNWTDNNWGEGKVELTENADGTFSTSKLVGNGTRFKFVKTIDDVETWYGANQTDGNDYGIHSAWCTGIELLAADNASAFVIQMASDATLSFKLDATNMTFDVAGWPITVDGNLFVKVASTEDFVDGAYLIVYEGGNLAFDGSITEGLGDSGNHITVNIVNNSIVATNTTKASLVFIQNGTIKSASGLYIGRTSDSNGMDTSDETVYQNNISIDTDGNAVILSSGGAYLRYNTSGGGMFRYYKSATYNQQKAIQLYKLVTVETLPATVTAAGWATWIPASNVEVPQSVSAYKVTGSTESDVVLSQLQTIPANEPVVLKGAGTHEFAVIANDATLDDVSDNKLEISDGTIGTDDGVYVLANHNSVPGFYKWGGGTLAAGKVYLPATVGGSRSFLGFGNGTTTGIEAIENSTFGECFDLQGRHVAQPTKGLYIMNGKKVVVK